MNNNNQELKEQFKGNAKISKAHQFKIKAHEYDPTKYYTITISPEPYKRSIADVGNWEEWIEYKDAFDKDIYYAVAGFFNKEIVSRAVKVELYGEFSGMGRYHLHGRIQVFNAMFFVSAIIPKLMTFGIIEIDTIADPQIWKDYITKTTSRMIEDGYEHLAYFTNIHEDTEEVQAIKQVLRDAPESPKQQKVTTFLCDTRPKAKAKEKKEPKRIKINN